MARRDLVSKVRERSAVAGLRPGDELVERLVTYLTLLARWNGRINLTALPLDPPTDAAIDRLIVEPLVAAGVFRPDDRTLLDVGSGAGSPAIPLALALPLVRLTMVEVRGRKSAFLREAAREVGLRDWRVETALVQDLVGSNDLLASQDAVTLRAVRLESELLEALGRLAAADGRLYLFVTSGIRPNIQPGWKLVREQPLPAPSELLVAARG